MAMNKSDTTNNQGFTIVELMIALSILSIILVMASAILINIGELYSKGVNGANLQNAARTIAADVSSNLQFSGNTPAISSPCAPSAITCPAAQSLVQLVNTSGENAGLPVPVYTFCIGTARYNFILNQELGDDPYATNGSYSGDIDTQHVLWKDTLPGSGCPALGDLNQFSRAHPSTGYNSYEMMPTHMRLTRFKVSQLSGDVYSVDVWMAYGDSDLVVTAADGSNTCNGGAGTQYCAISQISTDVMGRVY